MFHIYNICSFLWRISSVKPVITALMGHKIQIIKSTI